MQELTLKQERKGLKKGINDYLCMSAAKKLSKTITFLDKKWSNVVSLTHKCGIVYHICGTHKIFIFGF